MSNTPKQTPPSVLKSRALANLKRMGMDGLHARLSEVDPSAIKRLQWYEIEYRVSDNADNLDRVVEILDAMEGGNHVRA